MEVRSEFELDDEEETRNTADLLVDVKAFKPQVYVWRGMEMSGHQWVATDSPVGGDRVSLGTFGMLTQSQVVDPAEDDVRYVEIPETAWGDYCGFTYQRSNARSIRRDYADHVVTVTASPGYEVLVMRLGDLIPVDLFDAIVKLRDYPLYDEDDLSELESQLEQEDWESWGASDWTREIRKHAHAEDRDDDVTELNDPEYVRELFYEIGADGVVLTWQAETAVSGVWSDFTRAAGLAWAELQHRRMRELEAWARSIAAPMPGQTVLTW